MSKIENNRIYYDAYNEIRCDKFALEKFVKESEEKDKTISDLEAKLAEKEKEIEINKNALKKLIKNCDTVKCGHKISFAIEQLEEVKAYINETDIRKLTESCFLSGEAMRQALNITKYIDNQINVLKEKQHENKI